MDQPVSFSFHDAPPPEEDPPLLFVASEEEEEEEEADEFEFEFVGLLLFGCLEEFESDFMTFLRADESPRLLLFSSLPFLFLRERWFGGVKKPPPPTPIGFGGGNIFEHVVYSFFPSSVRVSFACAGKVRIFCLFFLNRRRVVHSCSCSFGVVGEVELAGPLSLSLSLSLFTHKKQKYRSRARTKTRESIYIFKSKDLARAGEINARIY